MNPVIQQKQDFIIMGYKLNTSVSEGQYINDIQNFWLTHSRFALNTGKMARHKYSSLYGVYIRPKKDDLNFSYIIDTESKLSHQNLSLVKLHILKSDYAVFTVPLIKQNNMSCQYSDFVSKKWQQIYEDWFPNSDYEYEDKKYEFEKYTINISTGEYMSVDIYIPVKKRL